MKPADWSNAKARTMNSEPQETAEESPRGLKTRGPGTGSKRLREDRSLAVLVPDVPDAAAGMHAVHDLVYSNASFTSSRLTSLQTPFRCISPTRLLRWNGFLQCVSTRMYSDSQDWGSCMSPLIPNIYLIEQGPWGHLSPYASRVMSNLPDTQGQALMANGTIAQPLFWIIGTKIWIKFKRTSDCRTNIPPIRDGIILTTDIIGGARSALVNKLNLGDEDASKHTVDPVEPLSLTNVIRPEGIVQIVVSPSWAGLIWIQSVTHPFIGIPIFVIPPPDGPCID